MHQWAVSPDPDLNLVNADVRSQPLRARLTWPVGRSNRPFAANHVVCHVVWTYKARAAPLREVSLGDPTVSAPVNTPFASLDANS